MASIITDLIKSYEEALPNADPKTRNWLLLNNTPIYVWILSVSYLVMVWVGPKVMKNRQPFSLQSFMVIYNFALVVLSLYMSIEIMLSVIDASYDPICAPYNKETREGEKELRVASVLWFYFFSKAIELIDTLCMILRKKNEQITFLHVFHHCSMLNIWWWVMMFIPGGLSYFGAWINSTVHVVMYAYYGLAAIPSMRKKLWWKKYITKLQLIQFVFTLVHSVNTVIQGCDFPEWGKFLLSGYMVILLVLFMNFYIHAYVMRKKAAKDKRLEANGTKHSSNGINGVKQTNGTTNGVSNGISNGFLNGASNGHGVEKKSQ